MNTPFLRTLEREHLDETASLFTEVFGRPSSREEFVWKYRESRYGRLYGVQATDGEGNVVAHVAAIPLEGVFGGEVVPFFQFVDAMVHPRWRGRNTLTLMIDMLVRFIGSHHRLFFPYVFPGPVSSKIGQRYRWLARLASVEDVDIRKERNRRISMKRWFLSFERVEGTPDVFDTLWHTLKPSYPSSLIRDASFISWRYRHHPLASYELSLVKYWGKPIGWIAVEAVHHSPPRVVDYLLPPSFVHTVLAMIPPLLNRQSVIAWIPQGLREAAGHLPYPSTPTPIELAIITHPSLRLVADPIPLAASLFYTMGDVDVY